MRTRNAFETKRGGRKNPRPKASPSAAGGNGKFQFTDVNAGSYASRYYRTVVP